MKKNARAFTATALSAFLSFSVVVGIVLITRSTDRPTVVSTPSPFRSPQAIEQEGAPRQSPEMNRFKEALQKRDWTEIQSQLKKSPIADKFMTLLNQETFSGEDELQVFNLIISLMEADYLLPRLRVISVRVLGRLNLSQNQQKQVLRTFDLAPVRPFKEDLLPQAFLSTVPFPKNITEKLKKDFASSPGRGKEVLFLTAGMKDLRQKRALEKFFLLSFPGTTKALKPFVAKSLILTIEPDLKTDEKYRSMLMFVKKQNDEIWTDIKELIR
ncbi:MAG: hypothetical protein JNM39_15535 [Bdellovibrionaceae bacterium]|nr:hypothetical protein [Pseudobdellovibrionaceae bacterium]